MQGAIQVLGFTFTSAFFTRCYKTEGFSTFIHFTKSMINVR